MYSNQISDEISSHLLTANFNVRSFLMSHRRENERHREISNNNTIREHSNKYSTLVHPRGFARLKNNSTTVSHLIDEGGGDIFDDFTRQLLDEYLTLLRRHWQRSNMTFAKRIGYIQSEFHRQIKICLKKSLGDYDRVLSHWIYKNRSR